MQALRSLKKGEYFTRKPVEFPKESQVWVKGDYVRSLNAYECYKWEDINHITFISGKTMVNADIVF